MTEAILDASAVLAFLGNEPGAEFVRPWLRGGIMSAVNAGEVLNRRYRPGRSLADIVRVVRSLELRIIDFTFDQATAAASLEPYAKAFNLSFADRACISLGMTMTERPVFTADHRWMELDLGIDIRAIREKRDT